jgi:hypothetical protein
LRQQHPALTEGKLMHYPMNWNNNVYKYLRLHEEGNILMLINGHDEEKQVDLSELHPVLGDEIQVRDLLRDEEQRILLEEGLHMPKDGIFIFSILDE